MNRQTSSHILLVRPAAFNFNPETAKNNSFQNPDAAGDSSTVTEARKELDGLAGRLTGAGVDVLVADDTTVPAKPDAVFPNNWISTHEDGRVILYPMYAPNRRLERRQEIVDLLKKSFDVKEVIDLSHFEADGKFMEGTGSMILDRTNRIAYACASPRTDEDVFNKVCEMLGYRPFYFHAYNEEGVAIYHTNVMMCVGDKFAVICLESITDDKERKSIIALLKTTGHEVVDITFKQMNHFAGNMLALHTATGENILALSQSAYDCLTENQRQTLSKYCQLIPAPVHTIERNGGGSVRCMIAEIFLNAKGE
ncbi:MAG: amidinotransferase [Chitinophagaceae bacterium]|nr:amidinotransferase [Chitinophagaceae bacterium]